MYNPTEEKYYTEIAKSIRDHVHGYISLTKFELDIIDTREFQRLKDIRQLTCQAVYPGARHTRFEHSLGVMELTRRAIKSLKHNERLLNDDSGLLTTSSNRNDGEIFTPWMELSASEAALLHDVGHCPFSHLGETQYDEKEVDNKLLAIISARTSNKAPDEDSNKAKILDRLKNLEDAFKKRIDDGKKIPGAVHEKLSCIIIMDTFYDKLTQFADLFPEENLEDNLYVDIELVIRCILGYEYDTSVNLFSDGEEKGEKALKENQKKNVMVRLINSPIFDMDKLDYIMRDSYMTQIGTPGIDTSRLFRNMHLNGEYSIVFTNRAVSALQNMIEARDDLYMYVYNHHAVVYSDFINTYIFRRLNHNMRDFKNLIAKLCKKLDNIKAEENKIFQEIEKFGTARLGMVSKSRLFSPEAIIDRHCSDSDWIFLLNDIYNKMSEAKSTEDESIKDKPTEDKKDAFEQPLLEAIYKIINSLSKGNISMEDIRSAVYNVCSDGSHDKIPEFEKVAKNVNHVYDLIGDCLERKYLKPWWKTYSEFNSFIDINFPDDNIREKLCQWIGQGDTKEFAGDEFRSQIAKHVRYITQQIANDESESDLIQPLKDGDFFVIQRAARFCKPETVRELDVAQKTNEMSGNDADVKYRADEYYIKSLTTIIPARDYYSIYAEKSFYIFLRQLTPNEISGPSDANNSDDKLSLKKQRRHYKLIEKIFVFVATQFIQRGEVYFQAHFSPDKTKEERAENENISKRNMLKKYREIYGKIPPEGDKSNGKEKEK